MLSITSSVNLGPVKDFPDKLREEVGKAVLMTAFNIEADAKIACPVDTGALRASIYTSSVSHDGRDQALAEAETLYWINKMGGDIDAGMPVSPAVPQPTTALSAIVAVGMAYGIHLEFGTLKMAARPYLIPAANRNKQFFNEKIRQAIQTAGRQSGWTP